MLSWSKEPNMMSSTNWGASWLWREKEGRKRVGEKKNNSK